MDRVLKGVLKYNAISKRKFVADMDHFSHHKLSPLTVFFSCMDARVLPSRFVDSESGQIFFVRNAGNMVPDYKNYQDGIISTEGAGLELGCIVNNIDNVVVCGHSDCKALNALYDLRHECDHKKFHVESPLKTWVTLHGKNTVNKFLDATTESNNNVILPEPLVLSFHIGNSDVKAHIDPENNFNIQDKLSQIHCLQQASHVSSYPFLKQKLSSGTLQVYAMWFDVHKGDVYFFSPKLQRFMIVSDDNIHEMLK